jgi:hypothetical protein
VRTHCSTTGICRCQSSYNLDHDLPEVFPGQLVAERIGKKAQWEFGQTLAEVASQ